MELEPLHDHFFVSKQIELANLKQIADTGIKTVINNRPDDETPGQVKSETLSDQARALGLNYHFLPVASGRISQSDFSKFVEILKNETHPILAFCRTGMRSTLLWAKSREGTMPEGDVLGKAAKGGYDIANSKLALTQDL